MASFIHVFVRRHYVDSHVNCFMNLSSDTFYGLQHEKCIGQMKLPSNSFLIQIQFILVEKFAEWYGSLNFWCHKKNFFKLLTHANIKHANVNLSIIRQFTNGLPE